MKLSEYIEMRCIIEEYVRMKLRDSKEHDVPHYIKEIGFKKAKWAREIVDKMDRKISEHWIWSDGWTNDNSISSEVWDIVIKK